MRRDRAAWRQIARAGWRHAVGGLIALGVALGWTCAAAAGRSLEVQLQLQHVTGAAEPAQIDAWLASPELAVEVSYEPRWLIPGVTARWIQTMPLGSRLEANVHQVTLRGSQIGRDGRTLSVRLDERASTASSYELASVSLRLPGPAWPDGRGVETWSLLHKPETSGAHQRVLEMQHGQTLLGWRLRYRWSDAPAQWVRHEPSCRANARSLDDERYRFRNVHPHAAYFRALAVEAGNEPRQPPVAGHASHVLRPPYPPPLQGSELSRNHLLRVEVPGGHVDRLSLLAQWKGEGECVRSRMYEALYSGEQLVELRLSVDSHLCGEATTAAPVAAKWDANGELTEYLSTRGTYVQPYDPFQAGRADCPATEAAPAALAVEALKDEVARLRRAYLAN